MFERCVVMHVFGKDWTMYLEFIESTINTSEGPREMIMFLITIFMMMNKIFM